jgi:hypothetical protein
MSPKIAMMIIYLMNLQIKRGQKEALPHLNGRKMLEEGFMMLLMYYMQLVFLKRKENMFLVI